MSSRSRAAVIIVALAVAAAPGLHAQTLASFEVASIHPSPPGPPPAAAGVQITKNQFRASYLSLRDYIAIANKMRPHQIAAADWVSSTRFDIVATLPPGIGGDRLFEMLQSLLSERFRLKSHVEAREFDVYALEAAKSGPALVRVPDEAPGDGPFTVTSSSNGTAIGADLGNGASLTFQNGRFETKRVTMAVLADTLGRFMDRPIVDQTRLEGRYDVAFEVPTEDYYPMLIRSAVNAGIQMPPQALKLLDAPPTGSVHDALRKIGLSLNERRAPLDVLVVESVQREPTAN